MKLVEDEARVGWVRPERLIHTTSEGRTWVVHPHGGERYAFDGIGSLVWRALDRTCDARTLSEWLARGHNAPRARIESDVRAFLESLERLGLVRRTVADDASHERAVP